MKRKIEVVIVAGGGGTRMWPLANSGRPKPFLPLAGGVSPLRRMAALAIKITGDKRVWVVTSAGMRHKVRFHLQSICEPQFIIEPAPRDTAAAMALGTAVINEQTDAEWILMLPADQWVRKTTVFQRLVWGIVRGKDREILVTFGTAAKAANLGYGYIKVGDRANRFLHEVEEFVEKPNARRAARYVRSRRWVWNCGMFLWPSEFFLEEVDRLLPSISRAIQDVRATKRASCVRSHRAWRSLPSISVDHGIMQRARNIMVACADIGWVDVGSWEALFASLPIADDGSCYLGKYVSFGGKRCFIYAPNQLTVNVGVQGAGLVVTRKAVLLFRPSQAQEIKAVVNELRRRKIGSSYV